jgi:hypothetical protein
VAAVLTGTTLVPSSTVAAPESRCARIGLEVTVDPSITDSDALRQWVEEDARKILDDWRIPADPQSARIRVDIAGLLYDYRVTLTAERDGTAVGEALHLDCMCNTDQLIQRLRRRVLAAVDQLVVNEEIAGSGYLDEFLPGLGFVPTHEQPLKKREIGLHGAVGLSLMVLGVVGLGVGIGLATQQSTPRYASPDSERYLLHSYRSLGWALIGGGAGTISTGLVLFSARPRSRLHRSRLAVSFTRPRQPVSFGLTYSGRF